MPETKRHWLGVLFICIGQHQRLRFLGQDGTVRYSNDKSVEEINMAKTVSCRDVGMDCDFVAKGETNEDIMQQAAEHARTAHNMTEIPPEVADKVRGAIRDEAA
jgi:predicted small metal-binding protein